MVPSGARQGAASVRQGLAASQSSFMATPRPGPVREREVTVFLLGEVADGGVLEPGVDAAFLDHEVGGAGVDVEGGDGAEGAVWVVRLEADVVGFGHGGDLLEFEDAAALDDVGLDHLDDLAGEEVGVVPLGEVSLAGGEWDVDGFGDAG